jgi:Fe-S cluster assembly protein SufD
MMLNPLKKLTLNKEMEMTNLTKSANLKELLIDKFDSHINNLNGLSNTFLAESKVNFLEKLKLESFPTLKTEDWKYTNIKEIVNSEFELADCTNKSIKIDEEYIKSKFYEIESIKLVFINGVFNEKYSDLSKVPDFAVITNLKEAVKKHPEVIKKHFNKLITNENIFNLINSTFLLDGLFIWVPENKTIELPIQVAYFTGSDSDKVLSVPRNLIFAHKNSEFSVVLNYQGYGSSSYLNNTVTEAYIDEDARVSIYTIQDQNENSYHIERTEVLQKNRSVFNNFTFSFGGKIIRNDIGSELDGEFLECHYYGLSLGQGNQHIDNHTFVDHAKPNCLSNELYKSILDDNSHGVFAGKILVRQDSQKTNAYQSNKTVLLKDTAKIDTQPQLEIFADDVKCSHGATVGQLDKNAYFYIRARGVGEETAKSMLIRAFAMDVLDNIKLEVVKEDLNHKIFKHLHKVEI